MSVSAITSQARHLPGAAVSSVREDARHHEQVEEAGRSARGLPLFVKPSRGGGFQASIRGHILELADPTVQNLAPTPDDLHTASVASDFAWFARRFLSDRGFDDYVSVTAWQWKCDGSLGVDGVDVTLTVSVGSAPVRAMLTTALERGLAHKFRLGRVRFRVAEA